MHFLLMVLFAAFVSAVFAGVSSEVSTPKARFLYGLRVFLSFIGIGLALSWLMYLL
ncbi:MAG TPA: hypothetical protein PLL06_19520 [Acidobacteriota bacterium]|nr:hypothetical protein [Acidobacteriota bacterium]HMZ81895.1 hypothetical protein [Acidobacteriota bacterium]HNB70539.1 hypothetical protein [Acidobacteriota bacterium]HNC43011.1 hypothetical protein [Acidobacteriota bacterium]HND17998.1 hypothetical protein [Acidobacteriota bacterium]